MSTDTTRRFGDDTIDRDVEDQQIADNPIAAPGNGGKRGLVAKLSARFAARDKQRTAVLKTSTKIDGMTVWLELDKDLSEDEMTEFSEAAQGGNRAAKRNGTAKTSRGLLAAITINEKNTGLYLEDPREGGKLERDAHGQPLTVHSDEWLEALGCEGDPILGLEKLIGYTRLLPLYGTYLSTTGLTDEVEVVDPTAGSSGD